MGNGRGNGEVSEVGFNFGGSGGGQSVLIEYRIITQTLALFGRTCVLEMVEKDAFSDTAFDDALFGGCIEINLTSDEDEDVAGNTGGGSPNKSSKFISVFLSSLSAVSRNFISGTFCVGRAIKIL